MTKIKQYKKYIEKTKNINLEDFKNIKHTIKELARTKGDRHPELLRLNQMVQEHKELGKGISKLVGNERRERVIERETLQANITRGLYKELRLKRTENGWEQDIEGRRVHYVNTKEGIPTYQTIVKERLIPRDRINEYDTQSAEEWLELVKTDPTFFELIHNRLTNWGYFDNYFAFQGMTSIGMLNRLGRDLFIPETVATESIPALLDAAGFIPKI